MNLESRIRCPHCNSNNLDIRTRSTTTLFNSDDIKGIIESDTRSKFDIFPERIFYECICECGAHIKVMVSLDIIASILYEDEFGIITSPLNIEKGVI